MRRLSIQLTTLIALASVLTIGCGKAADKTEAPAGGDSYAYTADKASSSADGDAAVGDGVGRDGGGYDYADDVAPTETAAGPAPSARMAEAEAVAAAPSADMALGSSGRGEGSRESKGGAIKKSPSRPAPVDSLDGEIAEDSPAKIASNRDRNIQSGTLTAGSFDDNLNPWVFDKFLGEARAQPDLSQLASAFVGQRTVLRVQDSQGRPIGNAKVDIDGKQMTTRSDGKVVWVQGWDSGAQGRGKAKVQFGNAHTTVSINNQIEQLVTLKDAQGTLPSKLDIALVIDATGSMGDELEFLKVEIRDIAEAINHHFPGVDQRFALVVYRDNGDQYTTRTFDFTANLDTFQRDLSAQAANGGGDYPEAMDAAMEAAAGLSWSSGDAARVTFLVADAPPHSNKVDDTLEAVDSLRKQGVAVYPVASSGVAGEAEFVMRTAAMLTGAQYLFLTDDSGVGNPHAEPHIPCYTVEQLAPLMVRAVRSELSGRRVEPEAQFSIRTVGQGQSGICQKPRKSAKIAK